MVPLTEHVLRSARGGCASLPIRGFPLVRLLLNLWQVLDYLLKVAPASETAELLELIQDFCPKWPGAWVI